MPTKAYHYSKHPDLDVVDPNHYGAESGNRLTPEYKHYPKLPHPDLKPRSYIYLHDEPEGVIQSGRTRHEVEVPDDFKFYDIGHDPLKFMESAHAKTGLVGPGLHDALEHEVANAGFHGYVNSKSPMNHVAAVFHPLKVIKPELNKSEPWAGHYALLKCDDNTHLPLTKDLSERGIKFHNVKGHKVNEQGQPEESRMVMAHGLSREKASELARKYGQSKHIQSHSDHNELIDHSGPILSKVVKLGHGHKKNEEVELGKPHFKIEHNGQRHRIHLDLHDFKDKSLAKEELDKAEPKHNEDIKAIADQYAKEKGFALNHNIPQPVINPEHGKIIADAYEQMKHDPENPQVKAAYGALIGETGEQYKKLKDAGYKFSKIKPGQANPYKTSKEMHQDVAQNKHLWYFPTEQGFGSSGEEYPNHPLMAPTEHIDEEGKPMLANDVFRQVHDVNSHAMYGSQFGPRGEHHAFLAHKQMFSPLAQQALASETMGQNNFLNYGPHGEHNRLNPAQTIYAPQKSGLLPEHIINGNWHSPEIKKPDTI